MAATLKKRTTGMSNTELPAGTVAPTVNITEHPAGKAKHGPASQVIRGLLLVTYFIGGCTNILMAQLLGAPLYFISRETYYRYMAITKESFGLIIVTFTQWFSPTTIRISGDASVAGQMRLTKDGRVQFSFPERLLLIANHQIYSDWLYLWWAAYANSPQMHGYIYIILKDTLRYLPILGIGMMFYGFIFLSRKFEADAPRIAHRLKQLKSPLDPMWLLIFPEGTNLSSNTRNKSKAWADKAGLEDCRNVLLPRSTGTFFILNELKESVEWIYDATVAYEGVYDGTDTVKYGQDIFTLKATQLEGRPPKSINFYFRRFAVSSLPLHDAKEFDKWMLKTWREKDDIMDHYIQNGRFPASLNLQDNGVDWEGKPLMGSSNGFIETTVETKYLLEFSKIFWGSAAWAGIAFVGVSCYNLVLYGSWKG